MTTPDLQRERRSEARNAASNDRISWTHEEARQIYTGWVSDTASSSVAFVTPTRSHPSPGESIELTFAPGGSRPQHRRVRVMRIAPYDRFFSLVGCHDDP